MLFLCQIWLIIVVFNFLMCCNPIDARIILGGDKFFSNSVGLNSYKKEQTIKTQSIHRKIVKIRGGEVIKKGKVRYS